MQFSGNLSILSLSNPKVFPIMVTQIARSSYYIQGRIPHCSKDIGIRIDENNLKQKLKVGAEVEEYNIQHEIHIGIRIYP